MFLLSIAQQQKHFFFHVLAGTQACTANVHYLLHPPQCVIWNGPLWTFSCFSYEDANGKLRKMFHGTQHVEMQVYQNNICSCTETVVLSARGHWGS